ncbi:hypothetical protein GGR50DRAFT_99231 [Xylaria sp. CBS 124048]|nr:hypothetical protein GGR50DRAFT_99231 [Xylaria sp. CBS 124048]
MSSNGQSFASNNPFRKKLASSHAAGTLSHGTAVDQPPPLNASRPPPTTFKSAALDSERCDDQQSVQQIPRKIVKKVRVQSPPPSSFYEHAIPVTRRETHDDSNADSGSDSASDSDDSSRNYEPSDPFHNEASDTDTKSPSDSSFPRIPANPFARASQESEDRGQAHDAQAASANTSRMSLDVNSFSRLLLTGHANIPNSTDTASISEQSSLNTRQGTAGASQEVSESDASDERKSIVSLSTAATTTQAPARKKPPPPSSRYGKLIKMELGTDTTSSAPDLSTTLGPTQRTSSSTSTLSLQETTNTNKPLPAPPFRTSTDEDMESPFDREAAGKLPEPFAEIQATPRLSTPPPINRSRSTSQTSIQSQKPAAPPPRRQGRIDEKAPSIYSYGQPEEDPPRSSMESSRPRMEGLRMGANPDKAIYAPAPPPPRRPGHMRQSGSLASTSLSGYAPFVPPTSSGKERTVSGSSITSVQPERSISVRTNMAASNGLVKPQPPPPPPTRKQSVRRPVSVLGMESGGNGPVPVRRVSREKGGLPPPPPPPPRSRSNRAQSDGTVDGSRRGSASTISTENEPAVALPPAVESNSQGQEILADLDALQREVDALMKKSASG